MADKIIVVAEGLQSIQEAVGLAAAYDPALDTGKGVEAVSINASIGASDEGVGLDLCSLAASLAVSDVGQGTDASSAAKTFFLVDSNNVLQPLGVIVLRCKGREDLLPGTRENAEEIPGRHGEIDFGSEFRPRLLELYVAKNTDSAAREQLKRTFAKFLNPLQGAKPLIFADDTDKTYYVKYAGKIDLSQWPDYMEFTIPLKASDPIIIGTWEKVQTGSGTLTNEGTFETPLVIEIAGTVTNPSVVVGGQTLSYTGSLASGDELVIDTGLMTVTFNGVNSLGNYSGGFPKLQPGETAVTAAAAGTTTWKWRDRWI